MLISRDKAATILGCTAQNVSLLADAKKLKTIWRGWRRLYVLDSVLALRAERQQHRVQKIDAHSVALAAELTS